MKPKHITLIVAALISLFFITGCSTSNLSVSTVRVKEKQNTIVSSVRQQPVLIPNDNYLAITPETKPVAFNFPAEKKVISSFNPGVFSKTTYRKTKKEDLKKAVLLNRITLLKKRLKQVRNSGGSAPQDTYSFVPTPSFIFGIIAFILILVFVPITPVVIILSILGLILFYLFTWNNNSFEFFLLFLFSLAVSLAIIAAYILLIAQATNS